MGKRKSPEEEKVRYVEGLSGCPSAMEGRKGPKPPPPPLPQDEGKGGEETKDEASAASRFSLT